MTYKFFSFFLLLVFFSLQLQGQFTKIQWSAGTVHSDVTGGVDGDNEMCNSSKIGFLTSIGTEYEIKNWLRVDAVLNYQERKALETLTFPTGGNLGIGRHTLCKYPTSPQSEFYDLEDFKHFPNFKYLGIEIIPNVGIGDRFRVESGFGLFAGLLLNKKQLIINQDDISEVDQFLFNPPFDLFGTVEYNRYDFGVIPKISFDYRLTGKINLGLVVKKFHSLNRLNDTFIDSGGIWNTKWETYYLGINVGYRL